MADSRTKIVVAGRIEAAAFQRAAAAAKAIGASVPRDVVCEVVPLTECGWVKYRGAQIQLHGTPVREVTEPALITVNGKNRLKFYSNSSDFVQWTMDKYGYSEARSDWQAAAKEAYAAYLANPDSSFVYFDVTIGSDEPAKMVFELDKKTCPRSTANFVALCAGLKAATPPHIGFLDTIFHRVQEGGWAQGGDVCTAPNNGSFDMSGTGGKSLYGDTFSDENFVIEHDDRGVLSMANSGLHTNASQFCISFRALSWMNKKFVALGKLISGSTVLDSIENTPTANGRPLKPCRIVACGEYPAVDGASLVMSSDAEVSAMVSFCLNDTWTIPLSVGGSVTFPGVFKDATAMKIDLAGDSSFKVNQISWCGADKLDESISSKELNGKMIEL